MSIVVYEHADDDDAVRRAHRRHACSSATSAVPICSRRSATPARSSPSSSTTRSTRKLMTLPDPTVVYPAHGAGSACGKNLSTELSSTIGEQKATNYALRAPDKPTFVALVSEGQAAGARLLRVRRRAQPPVARAARRIANAGRRRPTTRCTAARRRRCDADRRPQPARSSRSGICGRRSTSASKVATPSSPAR